MQIELEDFSITSFEEIINKKEKKCILYCDFNVANILFDQDLYIPKDFIIYPDSTLFYLALKWIKRIKINRLVSTNLLYQVIRTANDKKLKLYLFGDKKEIIELSREKFLTNYSSISLVGYCNGYNYDTKQVLEDINKLKPDVLLVGLGAGRQEKWLVQNFNFLPPLVGLSVGGFFQYLSGVKNRAPFLFLNLRLEWLYRIITELKLVWRKYTFQAIKFVFRVVTKRLNFQYRH